MTKKRQHAYFYRRNNLKHVAAFLTPEDYERIKALAKDADKSLQRYVTRLLESHIKQLWQQKSEKLLPTVIIVKKLLIVAAVLSHLSGA